MNMPTIKRKKLKKWGGKWPLSRFLYSVYFILIAAFIGYHLYFADKIIWKVHLNGHDFSGLTVQESIAKISNEFPQNGLIKVKIGQDYETDISFEDIGFKYLPIETTSKAFEIGRQSNFIDALESKLTSLFVPENIIPAYKYDESKMEVVLTEIKKEAGLQAGETHFEIIKGELVIVDGTAGKSFNDVLVKEKIINGFASENFRPVDEPLFETKPQFTIDDLDRVKNQLEEHINVGYTFKYEARVWSLSKEELISLFDVEKDPNGNVVLVINNLGLAKKMTGIASEIDRNPRGQVLEVENGKAVKFVSSEVGLRLKIKESSEEAKKNILAKTKEIPLQVHVASVPESENEFGISELLGVGSSRFKGSIPGRVYNIGLASSRVGGTMVPPGETFSFVKSVGGISRATGYTSAYIISEGRTVLGDGGGVCQVSTTLFRAALNSGLPIVERNAHSYRVAYYEQDSPVGIDAAIYSPSVDLKFKNDTPGYILIASVFDEASSSLEFRIYGTKDGREIEISEPKVLSRTPPPAALYEDDPTLAKGQTKQVEHSVWGASVLFKRTVKKGDETIIDDTFKSNYRAWRAIYKVGTRE